MLGRCSIFHWSTYVHLMILCCSPKYSRTIEVPEQSIVRKYSSIHYASGTSPWMCSLSVSFLGFLHPFAMARASVPGWMPTTPPCYFAVPLDDHLQRLGAVHVHVGTQRMRIKAIFSSIFPTVVAIVMAVIVYCITSAGPPLRNSRFLPISIH